ncbi:MAG: helix-turn-helix transcriptional regulator [Acidimicrobiales bacterium]
MSRPRDRATHAAPASDEACSWARLVRERRRELRLSQLELGRRAGLTQQAVSYIERGIGIPRVTTMVRVARSLGTTVEQLVPDTDGPDGPDGPDVEAGASPDLELPSGTEP